MKTSESVKELMPALIKAQSEIKGAKKDKANPHFGNVYATLESVIEACKEALVKNDILVFQAPTNQNTLVTRLYHKSGEFVESEISLITNQNSMQQLGSAITYARRYSLASILCIAQEDDDANLASEPQTSPHPIAKKPLVQKVEEIKKAKEEEFVFTSGKNSGIKFQDMIPEEFLSYLQTLENMPQKSKNIIATIEKMKKFIEFNNKGA